MDFGRDIKDMVRDILVTSSHRPSRRVRSFINDLVGTIARAKKINRGKKSLDDLAGIMFLEGYRTLIVVNTWKANPGRMDIYKRIDKSLVRIGYIVIRSIKLSREQRVSTCSIRSPKIVSDKCSSTVCETVKEILKETLEIGDRLEGGETEDGMIHIEGGDGMIYIWFSKNGKRCGPRIGIRSAVRTYKEGS
ncbi:MAG: hypothetical protein QXQ57_06375 [Sulfolobales archaeon]